jgi:euchromatic histone-lysine N-methyltransferase
MDQRTGWTLRVDLPVVNVNASSCELPPGLPVVKGGADAGRIARKRKVEYLEYQRQRVKQMLARKRKVEYLDYQRQQVKQMPNINLGDIPDHVGANELDSELQEANSSLRPPNPIEDPQRKRKERNEPEETVTAEFNIQYKEASERRSVVSKFHDLVLAHKEERLYKQDDPKTIKVFDHASEKLKFLWKNLCNNHIGSVPGVEVGDVFQSRKLLSIIGLHRPLQAGIYYLRPEETGHMVPLATSIVVSGGYEDNIDNGDVIIYAGQGGKDHHGSKKQVYDQELTPGNAALWNSWRKKQPVRLIRSCEELPCGYRYDGLYNVEHSWSEKGRAGYRVYKFKLRRKRDQPPLVSHIVRFRGSSHGKKTSVIKEDIAEGRHTFSIPVVNSVDNVYSIDDFKYLLTVEYPYWLPKPRLPEGCCCIGGCTDAGNCLCARRNGGEFPYRANGTLVKAKTVVYECGPKCRCPPTCTNRVAQHRLKHKIEIFRTPRKDWGVRTLDFIQAGAFIAEYTGNLCRSRNTSMHKFIFPISSIPMEGNSGDLRGVVDDELVSASPFQLVEDKGFKVDASRSGNASRFMRRSSRPNIFVQYVLHDHHEKDIPHVMLFALENIAPQLELSISSSAEQRVHSQPFQEARSMSKAWINNRFSK